MFILIQKSGPVNKNDSFPINFKITTTHKDDSDAFFDELILITKAAVDLLEEHKHIQNIKWGKSVEKNFNSIRKMVQEVEIYKRKRRMPLTWKGHTHNTRFLN